MLRIRMLAAVLAATLVPTFAMAQDNAPKTREQVKAETRAVQQAGETTPAGGDATPVSKSKKSHSTLTREQRKAQTLEARKKGEL